MTLRSSEKDVVFGPWRRWAQRNTPSVVPACGGVYLLGYKWDAPPPHVTSTEDLPLEVVYVGDAKNLTNRPLTGRHHRVERYKQLFGSTDSLWVTVAPLYEVGYGDIHVNRAFSFYIEALLVWKYTDKHSHPPAMAIKEIDENAAYVDAVVRRVKAA
jgi:hypothetical protein